jgi:cyclopropane-fatty-acyl-phospholipid synthase
MNYPRIIDTIFDRFTGPRFSVKLWDGKEYFYGTGSGSAFTLIIHDKATARRLLTQGDFGFAEAYVEGRVTVRGNLEACLRLQHELNYTPRFLSRLGQKIALATARIATMARPRNRKKNITYHYDLSNDFFRILLDTETMSYSAGRYTAGSEDLASAQKEKLDLICRWLDLPAGASVLDLGFGWGAFAVYAAKKMDWHITGYTLSDAQFEYCGQLIKSIRMENVITLEHRDMVKGLPANQFDAIVMLESIEHVGRPRLFHFFRQLKNALKPGGSVYIQATSRYSPNPPDRFMSKYVFPGGYLPAKEEYYAAARQAGLVVEKFQDDTSDYVLTMAQWIKNLESNRAEIEQKLGESIYRLWELWMHGIKVAFEARAIGLFRVHMRLPK